MIKSSLIIFIILLVHVSFAQIQFEENVLFQRQLQDPSRVIGFDVDGDFDNDMLITDPLKNRIIWIENSGNSLFQNLHVLIDNFGYPADTEIYDIDGDGILDILVSDNSTNKLRWLRNNGLGSFTIKNIDTISSSPKGAVCADLDNDGDWDILCTSFLGNQILAYYNDGTGNFGPKQIVSAEVSFPIDVQGVDIDGDDLKDIVSLCYIGSKLAWYKNLGNNNFSAQIVIAGPSQLSYPRCLSTADLDGDGDNEIITSSVTSSLTREILVFENYGFGVFGLQQALTTDYSNHESYTIDLDADADIDILTPTDIYLNDGTGSFSYNRVDSLPSRITTADFNGDSLLDLAYCFNTCNLAWKVNLGSGNFGNRQLIFNTILNVRELIYNDLDNDGLKDILVGAGDKFISICTYKNMGNGTYALADTILTGCTSVYSMEMIDLDGDGLQDLLMQIRQNVVDKIAWQKRLPSGDFGSIQVIKDSLVQFCEVHAADIDGDGDADILYGAYISGNQSTLNLITNDGFGYFGADIVLRQGVWQARDLQTADINNDGKLDVFFTDLRLMVGINLGTSSNFQFYNVGSNTDDAQAFSFADLDGDLDMDIVYACGSSTISVGSHIGILENIGVIPATGFVSTTLYPAWETDEIALKDLDMDGDIDIIAEQYSASPSLFWMQNDGAGNFSQGMLSPVIAVTDSIHATSIVIDDLDGDSDMDILYCSDFLGNFLLAWAENTGFQTIDSASSCANVPFQLGNQVLTTPGAYVDSLASIFGLDSIVHVTFSHIALPLVELSPFPFDSICIEEIITPLPIGTPIGGIYLGNAIINNEINLSLAGEGIYLLEYAYEDSLSGCSDTARSQMEIVICTAIEEIGQIPGLSIYPNPSNGFITIEIQQSEIPIHINQLKYELYSMDGQLLQVRNLNSTVDAIDLSNVGAGIYFLSILQGSNQKVFKLLVR